MLLDNTNMKKLVDAIETGVLRSINKSSKPKDIIEQFSVRKPEKVKPPKSPKNLGWGRMSD